MTIYLRIGISSLLAGYFIGRQVGKSELQRLERMNAHALARLCVAIDDKDKVQEKLNDAEETIRLRKDPEFWPEVIN